MKIVLIEPETDSFSPRENIPIALDLLQTFSAKDQVDLFVFPELFPGWHQPFLAEAKRLKADLIVGEYQFIPSMEDPDHHILNTGTFIDGEGEIIGRYAKQNLTVEEERDRYQRGEIQCVIERTYGNIGLQICYDFVVDPEMTISMIEKTIDALVVISAAFTTHLPVWHHQLAARSIECGIPVIFVNYGSQIYDKPSGITYGGGKSGIYLPAPEGIYSYEEFLAAQKITSDDLMMRPTRQEKGVKLFDIDFPRYRKFRDNRFALRTTYHNAKRPE